MEFGLLGEKLSHSLSPQIHNAFGTSNYKLIEVAPSALDEFFFKKEFAGLNVTIPYKKTVLKYCARLDKSAEKLKNVNTLKLEADGTYTGYNTDYFGFLYLLKYHNIDVSNKKAVVLGSGGASATVQAVLNDLGARVTVVSRNGEFNYGNLELNFDAQVIINATPVGMFPNNFSSPLELNGFYQLEAVVDLIYNPLKTKLLLDAERLNVKAVNGLIMLVAQAKKAEEIFLNAQIDDSKIFDVYKNLLDECQNIVLIGMPGCGKSTVARLLSANLNKKLVDIDALVEAKCNSTIPEIFERNGEEFFRDLESEATHEAGKMLSSVIATGGGAVKRKSNIFALKQNGYLVFLNRDVNELCTAGRPLSSSKEKLLTLFAEREPLYRKYCDCIVDVCATANKTVDAVVAAVSKGGIL